MYATWASGVMFLVVEAIEFVGSGALMGLSCSFNVFVCCSKDCSVVPDGCRVGLISDVIHLFVDCLDLVSCGVDDCSVVLDKRGDQISFHVPLYVGEFIFD